MKRLNRLYDWIEFELPKLRRSRPRAYAAALLCFAVALAIRLLVQNWLDYTSPFLTFIVATMVATLVGGVGPGILVLILSALSAWYFFIAPAQSFLGDATTITTLVVFLAQGLFLVFVGHVLNVMIERLSSERRRGEEFLEDAVRSSRHRHQINRELVHRIKNIFAVVSALVSQSAKFAPDVKSLVNALQSRFRALAEAQELLAINNMRGVDLTTLIKNSMSGLEPPGGKRLTMAGDAVTVSDRTASSLALILNELGTNAIKYGAWSNGTGRVEISWMNHSARPKIVWTEKGGPNVRAPSRKGFGTVLFDHALQGGTVERQFMKKGVICTITFDAADASDEQVLA